MDQDLKSNLYVIRMFPIIECRFIAWHTNRLDGGQANDAFTVAQRD